MTQITRMTEIYTKMTGTTWVIDDWDGCDDFDAVVEVGNIMQM